MFKLHPYTMDELRAQAAAKGLSSTRKMAEGPLPRPVNVHQVLDLGSLIYYQWRGRSFGVPPLPWKRGAALLDAYLEAKSYGDSLTQETAPRYYAALGRMAKIIWSVTRPVGKAARLLRLLRIYRNPFRNATEGELAELALFYLGRRTTTHSIRIGTPTPPMMSQTI